MIAQNEPAPDLFERPRGRFVRREPVVRRIIIAELRGDWRRIEPQQPAGRAGHDLKLLAGSVVEPVGGGEQQSKFRRTTSCTCHETRLSVRQTPGLRTGLPWRSQGFTNLLHFLHCHGDSTPEY